MSVLPLPIINLNIYTIFNKRNLNLHKPYTILLAFGFSQWHIEETRARGYEEIRKRSTTAYGCSESLSLPLISGIHAGPFPYPMLGFCPCLDPHNWLFAYSELEVFGENTAEIFGWLQLQKTSQFCSCLFGLYNSYELGECYLWNADSLAVISNSLLDPLEPEGRNTIERRTHKSQEAFKIGVKAFHIITEESSYTT